MLLVLGGHLTVRGPKGARDVAARDFFQGVFETELEPDEIVTHAWFPGHDPALPHGINEESRRHGDFALAGAVRAGDRLALFGVAPTPVLADPGRPTENLEPSPDLESSADFKLHLVEQLTARLFATA